MLPPRSDLAALPRSCAAERGCYINSEPITASVLNVHLLWRRGESTTAALLLGASDARFRSGRPRQLNEARLIAQARPALEAALGPEAFASKHAAGAALDEGAIAAIISEALAR